MAKLSLFICFVSVLLAWTETGAAKPEESERGEITLQLTSSHQNDAFFRNFFREIFNDDPLKLKRSDNSPVQINLERSQYKVLSQSFTDDVRPYLKLLEEVPPHKEAGPALTAPAAITPEE